MATANRPLFCYILESHELYVLSLAFAYTTKATYKTLLEKIKAELNIDLTALEKDSSLTEEQVSALHQFEARNFHMLNSLIDHGKDVEYNLIAILREKYRKRFGTFIVGWSCLYFLLISFIPVPDSAQNIIQTILGFALGTLVAPVCSFWFDGVATMNGKKGSKNNEGNEEDSTQPQ
jgi:hypothetical protein